MGWSRSESACARETVWHLSSEIHSHWISWGLSLIRQWVNHNGRWRSEGFTDFSRGFSFRQTVWNWHTGIALKVHSVREYRGFQNLSTQVALVCYNYKHKPFKVANFSKWGGFMITAYCRSYTDWCEEEKAPLAQMMVNLWRQQHVCLEVSLVYPNEPDKWRHYPSPCLTLFSVLTEGTLH